MHLAIVLIRRFDLFCSTKVAGVVLAIAFLNTSFLVGQSPQQNKSETSLAVSFTNHVSPIIVAKCGNCHVANSRGQYGIASYDALINGGSVTPGDPADSQFIEVIESGEMPKGGLKVSDKELDTLKRWIAEGAKFDGGDAKKPLMTADAVARARKGGAGRMGGRLQAVKVNPQDVGEQGVAWYATWDNALAEAKRSNRPIFFMSAAAQCSGVSGVF